MFPPIQCSKSSYFTQWLISEYLNRINEQETGGGAVVGGGGVGGVGGGASCSSSSSSSSSELSSLTPPPPQQHHPEKSTPSPKSLPRQQQPPPPPSPSSSSNNHHHPPHPHHHHSVFTTKHFKQLFSSSHHHHSNNNHNNTTTTASTKQSSSKPNNNEYKNGGSLFNHSHNNHHHHTNNGQITPTDSIKNIEFIQLLALNALEFTAPIYSFINKSSGSSVSNNSKQVDGNSVVVAVQEGPVLQQKQQQQSQTQLLHHNQQQQQQKQVVVTLDNNKSLPQQQHRPSPSQTKNCKCPSTRSFVQLSGHPGSFAPAGPNTVWKKMPVDEGPVVVSSSSHGDAAGEKHIKGGGGGTSLKELLEKLDLRNNGRGSSHGDDSKTESSPPKSPTDPNNHTTRRKPSIFPIAPHHQLSINSEEEYDYDGDEDTTPITVFFNSTTTTDAATTEASAASTSTTPPLLPPKIYNIPTHLLPNETQIYRKVNSLVPPDPLTLIIPKYVTETCYNSQMFLELEDLLTNFSQPNPTIMDIKLGTRTFLESEVRNSKPRPDLYQKLIKVDGSGCSEEEHKKGAVTKLTYMLFRERQSSSCSLGFRVEGVKIGGQKCGEYKCHEQLEGDVNFKVLKEEEEISHVFWRFCKRDRRLVGEVVKRLEFVRGSMESSGFFMGCEVIGASLLFVHDDGVVGVWLIDFAKTFEVGGSHGDNNVKLSHREPWVMGNREDGVLTGVDNILRIFKGLLALEMGDGEKDCCVQEGEERKEVC